jgi:hypothetical protein
MEPEMTRNHRRQTDRQRQWIGLGAAAGGIIVATIGQLAMAPSASADITEIINAIDESDASGHGAFLDALSSFSGGDAAEGLGYSLVGLDDYLIASSDDLLVNGYEALVGAMGTSASFTFGYLPVPTDLSEISADMSAYLADANSDVTSASAAFASDDAFIGLFDLAVAGEDVTESSQVGLVGLTDVLLGGF